MTEMHLQRLFTSERWHHALCLPSDERLHHGYSAPRGRLVDNDQAEVFLQAHLLFGPSALLLIGTPIRILQLYRSKIVTAPNYRGLVKAVGGYPAKRSFACGCATI